MDFISNLELGFSVALSPINLVYCFVGVFLGTAIGVLPGVGPVVTIAVLMPVTFGLPPESAIIMLAGIYYGAQYGGSTTAILVNLPGESSSVITCIDGYQMARQGRGGQALAIAAIGSFFAGTVGTLLLAIAGPPLASIALVFRSPEYFSLMVFALVMCATLVHGSIMKGILMALFGMMCGLVGTDINSGVERFTFDQSHLSDGIEFSVAAIGLFAFSEIVTQLGRKKSGIPVVHKTNGMMPSKEEWAASWKAILRGTGIGSFLGFLPGVGAVLATYASYGLERRLSKTPERLGRGAIEGVAAPESANNAAAQAAFIPTLTLGVPGSATMALMLGALMIHNVTPGPEILTKNPNLFWGLVASMWIGNLMLVVLNLPLIGLWVRMLRVPYRVLYPTILAFSCLGAFSISNSPFDIGLTAVFGLIGFILVKLRFELAPFVLGLILGPMIEENFRRSLILSRGDPSIFITEPISGTVLAISFALVMWMVFSSMWKGKILKEVGELS